MDYVIAALSIGAAVLALMAARHAWRWRAEARKIEADAMATYELALDHLSAGRRAYRNATETVVIAHTAHRERFAIMPHYNDNRGTRH